MRLLSLDTSFSLINLTLIEDGKRKDTARNILSTGEFVINLVSEELIKEVKISSEDFPPEVNEFEKAGLEPAKKL